MEVGESGIFEEVVDFCGVGFRDGSPKIFVAEGPNLIIFWVSNV